MEAQADEQRRGAGAQNVVRHDVGVVPPHRAHVRQQRVASLLFVHLARGAAAAGARGARVRGVRSARWRRRRRARMMLEEAACRAEACHAGDRHTTLPRMADEAGARLLHEVHRGLQ